MPNRKMRLAMVVAILASSSVALAQSDEVEIAGAPQVIEQLFGCRQIEDPEARLACFDREVDRVYQARESKDLVIADREQMKETRKGLFGFTLPKIGIFGGGDDDKEEEISEITTTITSFGRMSNGRAIFTVEGGARWMQTDNIPVLGSPDAGDSVVIETAAMGSYKAKIGKKRAIRVKRVD